MKSSSEFSVIRKYFSDLYSGKGTVLGPGDDCAVLRLSAEKDLATSCDTLVEGIHFPVGSLGSDIAYRAIATSASDLAAIGAKPLASVISLSVPSLDEGWLKYFRKGLSSAIKTFSLPLVGGDLTRGSMAVTVTVFGELPSGQALRRSGAKEGDLVVVSGTLGDARAGLEILQKKWEPDSIDAEYFVVRFFKPCSRLDLGSNLLGVANAAIDVSDGLLADVGHIAEQSDLAIEIDANKIPLSLELSKLERKQALAWALVGGDDYELCFTIPESENIPEGCTQIGVTKAGFGVSCSGFDVSPFSNGFQHFG